MGRRLTLDERAWESVGKLARRWGWRRRIAKAAGIPSSSMTRICQGRQPVSLHLLDTIEREDGVNPLTLLVGPDDELRPVSPDEMRLLRGVRALPVPVRDHLFGFVAFWSDEAPATQKIRTAIEHLKRLPAPQQDRVSAYLLLLHEGGLGPDLEVALALPPAADDRPKPAKSRRRAKA